MTTHPFNTFREHPAIDASVGSRRRRKRSLFDPEIVVPAIIESFKKLNPIHMVRNPVMFVTEVGAAVTTVELFFATAHGESFGFVLQIALWLWFTVLFANFAEAMAEGRGKAQADALRKSRTKTVGQQAACRWRRHEIVPAESLRKGDMFVVERQRTDPRRRRNHRRRRHRQRIRHHRRIRPRHPRSRRRPLGRHRRHDRPLRSDQGPRHRQPRRTFMDRMIGLIEGAKRQKTPNEIALNILLAALTIIFLVVIITLKPFMLYTASYLPDDAKAHLLAASSITVLVSLLVCLIPTTIGGLLSAIGIAGIDRMVQHNVLAMSGRAVEAAGDVDVLLLDKTGTITLGNRQATEFIPAPGVTREELADAAQLSSLADETPEGRSIVVLAKRNTASAAARFTNCRSAEFVPFTAQTRMSGVNMDGAADPQGRRRRRPRSSSAARCPAEIEQTVERISKVRRHAAGRRRPTIGRWA